MTARAECLAAAEKAVGARGAAYGKPLPFFTKVAKRWSLTLGVEITPRCVVLCMLDLKQERAIAGGPLLTSTFDTLVDIAGYAALLAEIDAFCAPAGGACSLSASPDPEAP